jgi:hypothetical protein
MPRLHLPSAESPTLAFAERVAAPGVGLSSAERRGGVYETSEGKQRVWCSSS